MLTELTDPFVERKGEFIARLQDELETEDYWSVSYSGLLARALEMIDTTPWYESGVYSPDYEKIKVVDFGDYQGTLVLVVGAQGYQPYRHWVTAVSYGSCSACDTIQEACDDKDYESLYTLALHMLQSLKEV